MTGVLCIYKPSGPTSHDIVDQIRTISGERRVGHAGTLDPLAEGILVILIGREATKQQAAYMAGAKEYLATLHLGATSVTDDAEGPITEIDGDAPPRREVITSAIAPWVGDVEQIPPAYSAIKQGGKKAYDLARAGQSPNLPSRVVHIESIELTNYEFPTLELAIQCGKGTYIRSLARDIGSALGCGAYLKRLVRTRSGSYSLKDAIRVEVLSRDNISMHLAKTTEAP